MAHVRFDDAVSPNERQYEGKRSLNRSSMNDPYSQLRQRRRKTIGGKVLNAEGGSGGTIVNRQRRYGG